MFSWSIRVVIYHAPVVYAGRIYLLKFYFGLLGILRVAVRVILQSQPSEGSFNVFDAGVSIYHESAVVAL